MLRQLEIGLPTPPSHFLLTHPEIKSRSVQPHHSCTVLRHPRPHIELRRPLGATYPSELGTKVRRVEVAL